jgi:protein-tyrosine phosphatase
MEPDWEAYRRNSKGWRKDPIARIHPRIWFGSYEVPLNESITHIINCAESDFNFEEFEELYPDNIVCLEAEDSLKEDITKYYSKFESSMNKFLASPECDVVYVHCECGINRSGFLILIYMCRKLGLNIQEAVKHILIQRPCALTNPEFRKQVVEFIKKHD